MNEKKRSKKRVLGLVLVLCMIVSVSVGARPTDAATSKTDKIFNAVKSAYGKSFPLTSKNKIKTSRKNIFGDYSTILGVSAKYFSKYTAWSKTNSKEEYICFICKAVSKSAVKTIKSKMKKFVMNEYKSNINYHSSRGNKLLKQAKVGSKGKYVYMFVLDTNKNKKAIKAFKGSL